ncbi:MAG: class I SAM-dependent methyltransferase, partial [Verrucomicrobiota bacterium]
MAKDTSRISITAHYTGYLWYKNGLSDRSFTTPKGRWAYYGLYAGDKASRSLFGTDIESILLQRHLLIDHLAEKILTEHGEVQILELACGLSPRGYRFYQNSDVTPLRYVEADLPAMANRKQQLLNDLGDMDSRHKVVPCNIFQEKGDLSLTSILNKEFTTTKPLLVITEGLVNYFPTPTIEPFWQRLAQQLQEFSTGIYLTDIISDDPSNKSTPWLKMGIGILAAVARGKTALHYRGDKDLQSAFLRQGFTDCKIHNPNEFYDILSIPVSRTDPTIRIVENTV